jgi:hypothetical protein
MTSTRVSYTDKNNETWIGTVIGTFDTSAPYLYVSFQFPWSTTATILKIVPTELTIVASTSEST